MPLTLLITKDGSHTIEGEDGITYHSTFGAIGESMHIFIERGLRAAPGASLRCASSGFYFSEGQGRSTGLYASTACRSGIFRCLRPDSAAGTMDNGNFQPALPGTSSGRPVRHLFLQRRGSANALIHWFRNGKIAGTARQTGDASGEGPGGRSYAKVKLMPPSFSSLSTMPSCCS